MSYRCQGCGQQCTGQMRRHVVYRTTNVSKFVPNPMPTPSRPGKTIRVERKEVAAEIPVCAGCLVELQHGVTLKQIIERFRPEVLQSGVLQVPQVGKPIRLGGK